MDNKKVYTIIIKDESLGIDFPHVLDIHERERRDSHVYFSFFKSKEDALKGWNYYVSTLQKEFDEYINTERELKKLEFDKNYPDIFNMFVKKYSFGTDSFSDNLPDYEITESDEEHWRKCIEMFSIDNLAEKI